VQWPHQVMFDAAVADLVAMPVLLERQLIRAICVLLITERTDLLAQVIS
jgi:hypothetical protein